MRSLHIDLNKKSTRNTVYIAVAVFLLILSALLLIFGQPKKTPPSPVAHTPKDSTAVQIDEFYNALSEVDFEKEMEPEPETAPKAKPKPAVVKPSPAKPKKTAKTGNSKVKVAIVIDDFGYDYSANTKKFLELDKGVTFSILPLLKFSSKVMQEAVNTGHECIIHMPMEPLSYPTNDPGPNGIYVRQTNSQIQNLMQRYFNNLPLAVGASNHMGSKATSDARVMTAVLNALKTKGLLFIDSFTIKDTKGLTLAKELNIPSARRHIFLDLPDSSIETARKNFVKLKKKAKKTKNIVVIAHCHNNKKFKQIQYLIKQIKQEGYSLVPVSEIVE